MRRSRKTAAVIVVVVAGMVAASDRDARGQDAAIGLPAERISQWIEELGHDEYAVREAATGDLVAAGHDAVAPLVEAARSDNLEVGSRVFQILMRLTEAEDFRTRQAALTALEEIAALSDCPAGQRAAPVIGPYKAVLHEQAAKAIAELGGELVTERDGRRLVRLGSDWVGDEADLEHLYRISKLESLSLENSPLTDSAMAYLEGLSNLGRLYLGDSRVTGSGLVHLKNLPKLTYLSLLNLNLDTSALEHVGAMTNLECLGLDGTSVTDAGLAGLQELVHLRELWLNRTKISDAGLAHLKDLKGLSNLDLVSTDIDGSGLVHLKPLGNLRYLSLKGTKLSDAGFAALGQLTQLEEVRLDGVRLRKGEEGDVPLGDAELAEVAKLPNLKVLWLSDTAVSDAGIAQLGGLQGLEKLYLQETSVTSVGTDELRKALPGCWIY